MTASSHTGLDPVSQAAEGDPGPKGVRSLSSSASAVYLTRSRIESGMTVFSHTGLDQVSQAAEGDPGPKRHAKPIKFRMTVFLVIHEGDYYKTQHNLVIPGLTRYPRQRKEILGRKACEAYQVQDDRIFSRIPLA